MAHSVVDTRSLFELAVVPVAVVAGIAFVARRWNFDAEPVGHHEPVGQSFVDCLKSVDSA